MAKVKGGVINSTKTTFGKRKKGKARKGPKKRARKQKKYVGQGR